MNTISEITALLHKGAFDRCLSDMYVCEGEALFPQRQRFLDAVSAFREYFGYDGSTPAALFSAPGRTELGGNHTDHQGGRVLAASVNMDIIGAAVKRSDGVIRLKSEGMPMDTVSLDSLSPKAEEVNTSAALLRGIAAKFTEMGYPVRGFDAYTVSNVPRGSGLSSSAAFEALAGNICNAFYADGKADAVRLAQIGQYAENEYFGKPCGLLDQTACTVGGVIGIDFSSDTPEISRTGIDLQAHGYALCMLDSGADHADLTDAYASIPAEMRSVAEALGCGKLSQTSETALLEALPGIRAACGDRAVLRALHFFADDARAAQEFYALQNGDFQEFLALVNASGRSSFMYLQNVSTYEDPAHEEAALTIALCRRLLRGKGAVRIHGGGFAGTVQAFVPLDMLADFREKTESLLGAGRCHVLQLRNVGSIRLMPESVS